MALSQSNIEELKEVSKIFSSLEREGGPLKSIQPWDVSTDKDFFESLDLGLLSYLASCGFVNSDRFKSWYKKAYVVFKCDFSGNIKEYYPKIYRAFKFAQFEKQDVK